MNDAQRKRYIFEARAAFDAVGRARSPNAPFDSSSAAFKQFRDAEKLYAIGLPTDFADFDEMDLTRCLIHFRALAQGQRLTFEEISRRASERQARGRLKTVRELWDRVEPLDRDRVMASRFHISFFEELEQFDDEQLRFVLITLTRLSREYPRKETPCTTA